MYASFALAGIFIGLGVYHCVLWAVPNWDNLSQILLTGFITFLVVHPLDRAYQELNRLKREG